MVLVSTKKTEKKIYNKFYQVKQVKVSAGGVGLGLYYVKKAVELHHWNISIDSDMGLGTTFTIVIPK